MFEVLRPDAMLPSGVHDLEEVTGTTDTLALVKHAEMLGFSPNGSLTQNAPTHAYPWVANERAEWHLGENTADLAARRRGVACRRSTFKDVQHFLLETRKKGALTNWVKVLELGPVEFYRVDLYWVEISRVELSRTWRYVMIMTTWRNAVC